jgi:Spy/CpxP family protein refolding chaperone
VSSRPSFAIRNFRPSLVFHLRTPMKSSTFGLSLLALVLAASFSQAVPEGDKPARKDAPAKRDGDRRDEFLKQHPELRETLEKLKAMSPEERQAWLKEHPEVAAKIEKARASLKERADNLTPEQKEKLKAKLKERGENLTPEQKEKLRAKMKERLDKMTPEEKAEFLKKHPELKEKPEGDKK